MKSNDLSAILSTEYSHGFDVIRQKMYLIKTYEIMIR